MDNANQFMLIMAESQKDGLSDEAVKHIEGGLVLFLVCEPICENYLAAQKGSAS